MITTRKNNLISFKNLLEEKKALALNTGKEELILEVISILMPYYSANVGIHESRIDALAWVYFGENLGCFNDYNNHFVITAKSRLEGVLSEIDRKKSLKIASKLFKGFAK